LRALAGTVAAALATTSPAGAQSTIVVHREATEDGARMVVDAHGEIFLGEDGAEVRAISPGGALTVEEARPGSVRRVVLRPGDGGVATSFFRDGAPADPGADDRAWIRRAVLYAARRGVGDADDRVERLRARGGTDAVLTEIAHLRGDDARAAYYTALLRGPLRPGEGARVLARALADVRAGGDRRVLLQAAAESSVAPPDLVEAALRAVPVLEGDGDRAELLRAVARRGALGGDGVHDAFVAGVRTLQSDADRRLVLMEIAPDALRDERVRRAAEDAARTIVSEPDRQQVLAHLAKREG
jgi:hypothetical protein